MAIRRSLRLKSAETIIEPKDLPLPVEYEAAENTAWKPKKEFKIISTAILKIINVDVADLDEADGDRDEQENQIEIKEIPLKSDLPERVLLENNHNNSVPDPVNDEEDREVENTKVPDVLENKVEFIRASRNPTLYKCPHCPKQFYILQIFNQHLQHHPRINNSSQSFSCPRCSFVTKSHSSLIVHLKTHNSNVVYSCDLCPYVSSNAIQLGRHRTQLHGESLKQAKRNSSKSSSHDNSSSSNNDSGMKSPCTAESNSESQGSSKESTKKAQNVTIYNGRGPKTIIKYARLEGVRIKRFQGGDFTFKLKHAETVAVEEKKEFPVKEINSRKKKERKEFHGQRGRTRSACAENPNCCPHCNKTVANKALLISHMRIHNKEKPFKCDLCSYRTNIKGNVKMHMKVHDKIKTIMKCKLCSFTGLSARSITIHMKEKHSGNEAFETIPIENMGNSLNKSKSTSSTPKKSNSASPVSAETLTCKMCSKDFKSHDRLQEHMRIHTGEQPFGCVACKFSSYRLFDLRVHQKSHKISAQIYQCRMCKYTTRIPSLLGSHIRDNHPPRDITKPASTTGKQMPALIPINLELLKSSEIPPKTDEAKPKIANQFQKSAPNWRKSGRVSKPLLPEVPVTMQHSDEEDNAAAIGQPNKVKAIVKLAGKHKCSTCAFTTGNKNVLRRHNYVHTGQRRFACPLCPLRTGTAKLLETHMANHNHPDALSCPVCSKLYYSSQNLKAHIKGFHRGCKIPVNVMGPRSSPQIPMVSPGIANKAKSQSDKPLSGVAGVKQGRYLSGKLTRDMNGKYVTTLKAKASKQRLKTFANQHGKMNNQHLSGSIMKPLNYTPRVILVFESDWKGGFKK